MATKKKDNGIVNIHGKEYQTVALRVQTFREKHPNFQLTTDIIAADDNIVVMKATIANQDGFVLATGHAEEKRSNGQINRTSALENCETSAIGRCLAALGIGGTEFASANEVLNANHQQNQPTPPDNDPQVEEDSRAAFTRIKNELQAADSADRVGKIMTDNSKAIDAMPETGKAALKDISDQQIRSFVGKVVNS